MSSDGYNTENGHKEIKLEPADIEEINQNNDNDNFVNLNNPCKAGRINGNKRHSSESNHSDFNKNLKQTNETNYQNGTSSLGQVNEEEQINYQNIEDQVELNNLIDTADIGIANAEINKTFENNNIEEIEIEKTIINGINNINNYNKSLQKEVKDFNYSPSNIVANSINYSNTPINKNYNYNNNYNTNTNINNNNNNNNDNNCHCLIKDQIKNFLISIFYTRRPYVRAGMVLKTNLINYLIVIIAISVFYFTFSNTLTFSPKTIQKTNNNLATSNSHVTKNDFESKMNRLKLKYPTQTNTFWANIESTFRHSVLNSKDPSILMVVNEKNTQEIANSLTDDIFKFYLDVLEKTYDDLDKIVIDPKNDAKLSKLIETNDSNQVKLILDERLMDIFNNGGKLAMLKNIQNFPAKSMILFYTYGDILPDAKYPGVLILMKLDLNLNLDDEQRVRFLKSTSSLSYFVESYLRNLWSKLVHEDQLAPLFSRIANNVILVNSK